jgi:hypothetical protein
MGCILILAGSQPADTQGDITTDPCPARLERAVNDEIDNGPERNYGELSLAFAEIAIPDGQYNDYKFRLDDDRTPPGAILPVLLKSIAGIENTTWRQYNDADLTLRSQNLNGTCDFGLMQINAPSNLFAFNPSLRSSTRGNIAAGATVLAEKWNLSVPGQALPVVNDIDPEQIMHWYYAFSSYNGGPGGENNAWVNNPNCGRVTLQPVCGNANFTLSRQDGADWLDTNLSPSSFPYQERVLYNLAYPRYPTAEVPQWNVGYPGLYREIEVIDGTARNYGTRPDDELFIRRVGDTITSLAPNILLFTHYPPEAVAEVPQQPLTFAFDLPLAANVTIDLLDATNAPIPNTTLINAEPFPAGWSTVTRRVNQPLPDDAGYRIFVERGDRADATTWYVGQYRQAITIVPAPASEATVAQTYLPLIGQGIAALPPNLVRNGDFADFSPLPGQTTQPAYWQVQTIINTEDGIHDLRLDSYTGLVGTRMRLRAAPRARQELRQRIAIPEPGNHTCSFAVEVAHMPPDSQSQLTVRVRPVGPGPVRWNTLRTYTLADNGTREPYTVTLPVTSAAIILSFLATFDENDGADLNSAATTRFLIDNVQVRPGAFDCVPPGPCQ